SQLTIGTSYTTLTYLLIVRGLALGCALQPTQLVALAVVPKNLITAASSLNNALRNVFQSFGIALLGTVVQSQTINHAATLSEQVTPTSPSGLFVGQLGLLLQAKEGISLAGSHAGAVLLIIGQIQRQAAVLAFGDAYRITFFAAVLALGLSLLLPGRGEVKADPSLLSGG
ncbi:MAG TPA: hypothetical protein VKT80_10015, partial [Chloroflexota bacterium]|nr:hypothetical protein [Chloroflexota bacterium]